MIQACDSHLSTEICFIADVDTTLARQSVFARLAGGAPPSGSSWQFRGGKLFKLQRLLPAGRSPLGRSRGPWQSPAAPRRHLCDAREQARCDMLFKVQQPKRPGKDSRVGLEIYLRGVRCRVRHDGRVKLLCELNTIHMAKCAAFAPQRRLEVPNGGNVHRPSPQVVPDWTA